MLKHRVSSAMVLLAGLLLALWADERLAGVEVGEGWRWLTLGGPSFFPGAILLPVCFVLSILAGRELAAILKSKGIAASKRISAISAGAGLIVSCINPRDLEIEGGGAISGVAVVGTAAVLVMANAILFYSRGRTTQGVVAAVGGALLAFVYLGLMFGFYLAIRRHESVWVLLWIVATAKCCDIGAYFSGRAFGRHKLIPWLSPGKTWEGLAGGLVASAIASVAGLLLLDSAGVAVWPGWLAAGAAGVLFGGVGQAGDLLESLFKRDAGMKDASATVPGFGGVLDVLDSPLLVAPVAYWWVVMFV